MTGATPPPDFTISSLLSQLTALAECLFV